MVDDLSYIVGPDGEVADMPYQIWYPAQASAATYLAVARRFWCLPDRRYVVYGAARAMVVCGYYEAWATLLDELDGFVPSRELFVEAEAAPDLRFLRDLHRLREERCPGIGPFDLWELESYCEDALLLEPTRRVVDAAENAKLFGKGAGVGAPKTGIPVGIAVIRSEEEKDVFVARREVVWEGLPKERENFSVWAEGR